MNKPASPTFIYEKLLKRLRSKYPRQPEAANALPPLDTDFTPLFETRISRNTPPVQGHKRKDLENHKIHLRYISRGQPEITALHMLLISYLRRNTPHTKHASALFFRLWRDHTDQMLETITARDLLSALRTFADCGETTEQKLLAQTGFIYGHMIKLYESERYFDGLSFSNANWSVPAGKTPHIGVKGLDGINLGADASYETLHIGLIEHIQRDPIVGAMIVQLIAHVQNGETLFSRYEHARVANEHELENERFWPFGFNPES